ncbi:2Fe-2S iron-sulfur cluster-binding protein [Actinomadura litoris]|uniref:2Fe-2S iron-sulfur cluster binding domain-containing protein n=1 Tax=Actinomadura litoris TaxID=2678616 RepID=A0A7K1KXZ6_9ACTN|nr:2Fe-2S iron-sulfur cluster-binding protein [Actinomadura litoris]MUN36826.1 2Fe-2S iron-sulfur cluster binding domain-containing protein [Actinomadura litoris]
MTRPTAELYDGYEQVRAEIDARPPDRRDHVGQTRRRIDTFHPRRLALAVAEIVVETPTTKTFRMRRPDGGDLPPFLAGQYVTLFADGTTRPFAISSGPGTLDRYDLTVRRVPGGRISNLLLDTLKVGDTLTSTGPMGTFHHNPLFHGEDVVFLAGGSGVAPAMSMIRDITGQGLARRLHLIYGSRSSDDVIFEAELAAVTGAHRNIRVDHVVQDPAPGWTGRTGLIDSAAIAALAGPLGGRMVYVCGPQALYPHALQQLTRLRHPRRRTRFEANGAPARPQDQPHWPRDLPPEEEVTVTVRGTAFRTPRGRPLLDALEDNGVRPESACRSGECSLCRVRVLKGEVHSAEEARLRMADHASGHVHSCVAYPLTDVELDL